MMSETGPADSQSSKSGQPPPRVESLFDLVAAFLVIACLWLLAALLTETINASLVPLDELAYPFVYLSLVFLLLGITILFCWAMKGAKQDEQQRKVWINTPDQFQRGFLRLRRWQSGSSRRTVLFAAAVGVSASIVGQRSMKYVDSIYAGPRQNFYEISAMVIGTFGIGAICLLALSLFLGLRAGKARSG